MLFSPRYSSIFNAAKVFIALLPALVAALSLASPATAAESGPVFEATFLQLWDDHNLRTREQWETLCANLRALGVREVVVQWTLITERPFAWRLTQEQRSVVPMDPVREMPAVRDFFQAAEQGGLKVWLGLTHDPDWWEAIKNNSKVVEVYLNRFFQDQTRLAETLTERYGSRSAFAGFYIPQEIDDGTWLEPDKRAVLAGHLTRLTKVLKSLKPEARVAISCFANGKDDPIHYAGFWRELMTSAGLDEVFVQDGVGAGKLTVDEAFLYLSRISETVSKAGRRARPVVEIFKNKDGEFIPASMERIKRQLESAYQASGPGVIAFSLPDYADPSAGVAAGRLYRDYQVYLSTLKE